ncbi:hypothetical protein GL50803_0017167 [Giardia duodenalis]|uniref:Uncharacterized protein n=1 Tax=Giardia intestinalis (strain ATCC 50803 / WB clone C6) TaxID=184922 RepID=A8BC78_GIAIC|nr:hypothetical protein GL50803_0017167 [Giardia intestinalis]KAE8301429.1 hypothetical protein GL50803_0017167 [Giardia intestinalis]|eukprot:XP_001707844.1 Hypothetical protein GL50803_17167 [Giardia lamblia ATCC 50803]
MQALYFPPAELPAGYVHDGAPLWQKTILVSGYDVNGTLFLEPRGKQSFLEQNTADPTNEESAPKKKRKLTKQSVMAGYAPRFPISWLSNISPEIKTALEQYLFSLPRVALPKDTAQLSDFYNGNFFELTNQTKAPTCAEISKNPVDLLTKILNVRKQREFTSYHDIYVILTFAIQTPFTLQTIEQLRSLFSYTAILQPSILFSSLSPSDPQRCCIALLASDLFLKPFVISLTRIMSDTERMRRAGDIIAYLAVLYENYKNIIKMNLFCDALSILLSIPEEEPFVLQPYATVFTYICSLFKSNDRLSDSFTTELSRAGVNKKIMLIVDAIVDLPQSAVRPSRELVASIRKAILILAHMRYSDHGSKNLPTGQYLAEYKERADRLISKIDELLAVKKSNQESEESEEASENSGLDEGQNAAFIEETSQWKRAIACLYDKKSPSLSAYTALFH